MDKYIEAEKRLAELLGWHSIDVVSNGNMWGDKTPKKNVTYVGIRVPQWTRDWAACGSLMVEHEISVLQSPVGVSTTGVGYVNFNDHPDKDAAVRYAIVMAVIQKLESRS